MVKIRKKNIQAIKYLQSIALCFPGVLLNFSVMSQVNSTETIDEELKAVGNLIYPQVNFLVNPPIIDGQLDEDLQSLPVRKFNLIEKSSPGNPDTKAQFRLAYGTEFLYLFIEADGDKLNYRDRAFQNGDGFNLLLARPKPDNAASDEFYVLAGGAVKQGGQEWARHIFWYHNVTHIFKRTSDETRVEFQQKDGKISFELYLPWKDVKPYHPWLSTEGIGFNLKFNKAIGNDRESNSLDVYEGEIWRENRLREYNRLQFEKPAIEQDPQGFSMLARNNTKAGDIVEIKTATVSATDSKQVLTYKINSGEGQRLNRGQTELSLSTGLNINAVKVEGSSELPSGGYQLTWLHSGENRAEGLSILSSIEGDYSSDLKGIKSVISRSSYETLQLFNQEVSNDLKRIKNYELASHPRLKMALIENAIEKANEGVDVIAEKRGYFRKGFRSEIDNTLQPYSVVIPQNYVPHKKYPLVVFLHGSASDETKLGGAISILSDCCVYVGPFARGHSNYYVGDNPQKDIAESIRAVVTSYSIDEDKIVLVGFSMGGYGVIHTYAQNPDFYLGFASILGPPKAFGEDEKDEDDYIPTPNYLNQENQMVFKGADIFLMAGKRDNNVRFEGVEQFYRMLKNAGIRVDFSGTERGHSFPNNEERDAYLRWLERIIDQ